MPAVAMYHERDPREVLQEKVGDLTDFEIFANDVLIAIYERPTRTKSGIHLTDTTRAEDVYQGKIGLVVKMGPMAFVDTDKLKFRDRCSVGDWVILRPADGWACTLTNNKVPMRFIQDTLIRGRVAHPDLVY